MRRAFWLQPFTVEANRLKSEAYINAFTEPKKYPLPFDLQYAQWIVETGWPPEVLDNVDIMVLNNMNIYKNVLRVYRHGGNYMAGE